MKKIMAILLAAVMVIGLAACGNSAKATTAAAETPAAEAETTVAAETEAAPAPVEEVTIFLTRHGKTLFNTIGRVQGWCDSPLTDKGIEVAENLGIGLKESGITFDAAYSSDLGRQRDTARIVLDEIGQTDMVVRENRGLREQCFGSWEGEISEVRDATFCEIAGVGSMNDLYPQQEYLFSIYVDTDTTGLAEDLETATTRFVGALTEIAEASMANGESTVLVVSSGGIINTLLEYLQAPGQEIKNASVTMLTYKNGQFTVGVIGDLSYADLGASKRESK